MMFMPSIFGDSFLDDFMRDPVDEMTRFARQTGQKATGLMLRTDIKEKGDNYEMVIDLPGYKKEDLKLELKEGVLTITASRGTNNEETVEDGKYIRRERFVGTCTRSYFVGKALGQEDIKARFDNGTLVLTFPKDVPQVEKNHTITIEG